MALSTAAAIIGGSVLSAGGSAIAAGKSNSAANKAADTATQTARENNALTKEIYQENKGVLSPFVGTGTAAGALLNDFYGIKPAQPAPATPATPTPATAGMGGYGMNREGGYMGQGMTPAPTAQPAQPKADSRSAFANYIANSDYAFQQGEGNNQVNSGYAGTGTVQSGAAMKALERFRQNLQSGYRQQWAGGVANQQAVGLGAASALAGVSTNYANTVAASNTAASDARANAALSQQSPFANALGMAGAGILKGFG